MKSWNTKKRGLYRTIQGRHGTIQGRHYTVIIENEKGGRSVTTSIKVVKKAAIRAECSVTGRKIKPKGK